MINADLYVNPNIYSFTPEAGYEDGINILPAIRAAIAASRSVMEWEQREAKLCFAHIESASAFTVSFNYGASVVAESNGTSYVAEYEGVIEHIVFAADCTATAITVHWNQHDKTHKLVTLPAPSGATVSLTDDYGYTVYPDADGKYEMRKGWYRFTIGTAETRFFYDFGSVPMQAYDIAGAVITLGADLTYTGIEQTKGVTVAYGGVTLTANTDYSVSGNKGTNAGSYEMTINGCGIFTGSVTKAWSIAKATPTMSLSSETITITAGNTGGVVVTTDSDGELSVASSDEEKATAVIAETTVTITGVAAGTANITVSQAESDNYNAATPAVCAATITEPEP